MATLEQIVGRFFTYAKDRQRQRFKALTVRDAINVIQEDFNRKTGLYRLRQPLSIATGVVDLTELSAADLGGPVLRVEDLSANNARLDPISVDELDNLKGSGWRTSVDPPLEYWVQGLPTGTSAGAMVIHVWPFVTVAAAGSGVDIHYTAIPPDMKAKDAVPVIPPGYHIALVWGALEMLMAEDAKTEEDKNSATWAGKQYQGLIRDGQAEVLRWQTG